jgi:hypothetical protein
VGLTGQDAELVGPGGIYAEPGENPGQAAQVAVAEGLLLKTEGLASPALESSGRTGTAAGGGTSSVPHQEAMAAQRFASLPAAARHAWLMTHLTALRAGRITPSEIP